MPLHFRSHLTINELLPFKSMRDYRLSLNLDGGPYNRDRGCESAPWRIYEIKEQLRLVCDTLASNDNVQSLSVIVPCCCCIGGSHGAALWTLSLLKPLKRLRVAKPVILEAVYDDRFDGLEGDRGLGLCPRPECRQLAGDVQAALGRLEGEPLSHEEELWRYQYPRSKG